MDCRHEDPCTSYYNKVLNKKDKIMIHIKKLLLLGLIGLLVQGLQAQPPHEEAAHQGCPMHQMVPAVEFQSTKICFAPQLGAFVVVDSIECAVHLVAEQGGRLDTIGSYQTDLTHKRHDLKNIMRPVSVSALGQYVAVLASAQTDSAYLLFLDRQMHPVARRGFSHPMYAMHFEHGQVMVVGRNAQGYDIEVLPLHGGFEAFEHAPSLGSHYRVAKQSERIKQSDPIGIGLTAVLVAVVFLALICVTLILVGSSKLISGIGKDKKTAESNKKSSTNTAPKGNKDGEVIAAIAAAIHLFNEELHDEEDTVITIQKVEREWTPWNAKYYNMNHYFNNRR